MWSASMTRRQYVSKGHGGQRRAFRVALKGEGVSDFGGPYRAVFEDALAELQNDTEMPAGVGGLQRECLLPVLVPTPNRVHSIGSGQDRFIPNPMFAVRCNMEGTLPLYRMVGQIIGMAVRGGFEVDVRFPSLVWTVLVGQRVGLEHLEGVDSLAASHLATVARGEDVLDDTGTPQLKWNVTLASGRHASVSKDEMEDTPVVPERAEEYAKAALGVRLRECNFPLLAMRNGLARTLPVSLIQLLFTGQELEELVCGADMLDVDLLESITEYEPPLTADAPHIRFFWNVLRSFTAEQSAAFLRFVWARSRLPRSAKDLTLDRFRILPPTDAMRRDPERSLPVAQTCFFSLALPPYASAELLRDRLLLAIEHSPTLDGDVVMHHGWETE
jgi:hypothetical protein